MKCTGHVRNIKFTCESSVHNVNILDFLGEGFTVKPQKMTHINCQILIF